MDRHPELRHLAEALIEAVYADQKRQATAKNTNKPKEAQHENHT